MSANVKTSTRLLMLGLPGAQRDRRAYARVVGALTLAAERIFSVPEAVTYVVGVSLEAVRRRKLLGMFAPVVRSIRATRQDDRGFRWLAKEQAPEELTAPQVRALCPRIFVRRFDEVSLDVVDGLGERRTMTFKEFAKLSFLTLDVLLAQDPALARRIVRMWPPERFGL